jgi:hypothetical protein
MLSVTPEELAPVVPLLPHAASSTAITNTAAIPKTNLGLTPFPPPENLPPSQRLVSIDLSPPPPPFVAD